MSLGRYRAWSFALALLAGCAGSRGVRQAVVADRNPAAHSRDLEAHYRVRYPDVLAVEVASRPDLCGSRTVGLDGRIDLGGPLVADGRTAPQIACAAAERLGMPAAAVSVRVQSHKSQHVYLFGEVGEAHHVVAYQGPETILDLLQRIGGAADGAALGEVHVVRAHVADGKPPEVFHVDLRAIVSKQDLASNIRLEPNDRVHVGQTRAKRMSCYMPPWFQLFCKKPEPRHDRREK